MDEVKTQLESLTAVIGRLYNQTNLLQLQVARLERILEEIHDVKFGTHVTTGRLADWSVAGNAVNG